MASAHWFGSQIDERSDRGVEGGQRKRQHLITRNPLMQKPFDRYLTHESDPARKCRCRTVTIVALSRACFECARDVETKAVPINLLGLFFFVGGLARLLAWIATGSPICLCARCEPQTRPRRSARTKHSLPRIRA